MFGIGTFESVPGDRFPGVVVDERVLDLRPYFGVRATTSGLLSEWDEVLQRLREIVAGRLSPAVPLDELRPLPPVQPIGQLFCAGANYRKHRAEITASMGLERGSEEPQGPDQGSPFVFTMPGSSVSGARDDLFLWGPGHQHDWELELALVVGRPARNVSRADAMSCVAGYMICNDVSTRDVMFRANMPLTDFLMSKGRPGFFPMGPYVVPREFISDYRKLRITLKVAGEVMQDDLVEDIIFGVEDLVSYVSTVAELWPGDIILTGSPGGNAGYHGNRWLRPGDVVEGEISGLGAIYNRCVAPEDAHSDRLREER